MQDDEDWDTLRRPRSSQTPSISPVRVALLFGSAAIAFALMVMSYLGDSYGDEYAQNRAAELDAMITGSIGQRNTYVVRKSILQSSRDAVCIIRPNGSRTGEC